MEIRLPCGDQWKAEKLAAFWRWPITRCFIKSERAGLIIDHSIIFCLDGEHWRAVQLMLLLSIWVAEWPTVWGKSCSFRLQCVSFVNFIQFVCTSFPLGFKGGMGDLIIMTFLFYFAFLSSTRIYTWIYIRGVLSDSRYTFIWSVLNTSAACNRQLNSQVFLPPLGWKWN